MKKQTEQSEQIEVVTSVEAIQPNIENDGFTPVIDFESFQFCNLEKEGDSLIGTYLGTYADMCERLNAKPKPRVKGHVFFTEKGLQVMGAFHSLDKNLRKDLVDKLVKVVRLTTEFKDSGEVRYVNYQVLFRR